MAESERKRRGRRKAEEKPPEEETSAFGELEEAYEDVRHQFWSMFSLPEDFGVHMRAARREVLLAFRSLIDARLASLEEAEKRRDAGRRTRVHVE